MASFAHTLRRLRVQAQTATARGVLKDVLEGYERNDILTYGSAIAFQVLFALIPLTLFALGLLGFLGLQSYYTSDVVPQLRDSTSIAMFQVINATVLKVLTAKQGFWITIGGVVTVWEMSGAVRAIMGVFDRIYECRRERGFRERYTVSILLAIGTGLLLLAAFAVTQLLGNVIGFLRWPIAIVLMFATVTMFVRYAPAERDPDAQYVGIGSVIVVLAWVLTSVAFGFYATRIADYGSIFGNLATVIILFEYLYLSACAFLTGAQLDALMRNRLEGS